MPYSITEQEQDWICKEGSNLMRLDRKNRKTALLFEIKELKKDFLYYDNWGKGYLPDCFKIVAELESMGPDLGHDRLEEIYALGVGAPNHAYYSQNKSAGTGSGIAYTLAKLAYMINFMRNTPEFKRENRYYCGKVV